MATDDELDTSGLNTTPTAPSGPSGGERAVKWLRYVVIGGAVILGVAFIIWIIQQRNAVNASAVAPTSAPTDGVTPAPPDVPVSVSGPILPPTSVNGPVAYPGGSPGGPPHTFIGPAGPPPPFLHGTPIVASGPLPVSAPPPYLHGTPIVASGPLPMSHPAARTFTVRPWPQQGSTLSSIAGLEYHNPALWPKIYSANRAQIGSNPDLIKPGMVLTIPA